MIVIVGMMIMIRRSTLVLSFGIVPVAVCRLKQPDGPGENQSCQQGDRKREAIVRVKFDFGKQVTQSDADEYARGKCQSGTDDETFMTAPAAQAKVKT